MKSREVIVEFSTTGGGSDDEKSYLLQLASDLYDALYIHKNTQTVKDVKNKIEMAGGSVKILHGRSVPGSNVRELDGTFQVVMYHPKYFKQGYLIRLVGDNPEGVAEDQLDEKWSEKYKRSINCSSPKGFSQRAHCQGRKKHAKENINEGTDNFNLVHSAIKDLLPVAMSELELEQLPKIHIKKTLDHAGQPSFGSFNGKNITLAVSGRHPVDICRTLAHELTHFAQGTQNKLDNESGRTGSPEENEANSIAGIIMRKFSVKHPEYMKNED
jgi:hypothetical protein